MSKFDALEAFGGFFGLLVLSLMLRVVLATWMAREKAGVASLAFSAGLAFAAIASSVLAFVGALFGCAFVGWLFFRREVAQA